MILSHAFLGCDTSDISKETWDLAINGCVKFYQAQLSEKESTIKALEEKIKGLVEALFGVHENLILGNFKAANDAAIKGIKLDEPHSPESGKQNEK